MRQTLPASVGRSKDRDILVARCLRALVAVPSRQAEGMYHEFICRESRRRGKRRPRLRGRSWDAWDNRVDVEVFVETRACSLCHRAWAHNSSGLQMSNHWMGPEEVCSETAVGSAEECRGRWS